MEIALENKSVSTGKIVPARDRFAWVDFAKGLAIILVVYRHCLVGLDRSGLIIPTYLWDIQEYVYNFRMPVFFMLSGIFLAKSLNKTSPPDLAKKKVNTLLYPYVLWTFILITIQILFSSYTNTVRTYNDYAYIITQPRNLDHMWYLLALFNTSILYLLLFSLLHPRPLLHIGIAIGLYLTAFFIRDYSLFSDLFYHYIFLVIGAVISSKILSANFNNRKMILWLLLVTPFFIIGQWAWRNKVPDQFQFQLLFLLIILIACLFFYFLCQVLYHAKVLPQLVVIGKNSLPVYIMHLPVISGLRILMVQVLGIENVYLIAGCSLIFGIAIPVFIYNKGKRFGIQYLFSLEPVGVKKYG